MRSGQGRRLLALCGAVAVGFSAPGAAQETAPTGPVAEEQDPALYKPVDSDERGLWMQMDEAERVLRTSPSLIQDKGLNEYVRGVLCRTVGQQKCANVRVYITRTPHFNASMAPNGMMEVWSGLLLRTQNEAQLAAVLGHEYAHFNKRHSLLLFRDIKRKTDAAAFLSFIPFGNIAGLGLVASIFGFSREMEREADQGGLELMHSAGYDTGEAAVVWERLRAEMDATAAERKTKSRKDKTGGIFATHPPSADRVTALKTASAKLPGVAGENGAARYRDAIAAFWPGFVDAQLKLNDFGASEYLLASLATNGWTSGLLYARGELYRRRASAGDLDKAVGFYGEALAGGGELPELWRGRGLALQKLGRTEEGKTDLREYLRRAPNAPDRAMMAMLVGDAS